MGVGSSRADGAFNQAHEVFSTPATLQTRCYAGSGPPPSLLCRLNSPPHFRLAFARSYTCGFADQTGDEEKAPGGTLCLPLAAGATWGTTYGPALRHALSKALAFGAQALVVSLGVDGLQNDPVAVRRRRRARCSAANVEDAPRP